MSGVILNVTDLNSNANHLYNRPNNIGDALDELTVNEIDEKRNENRTNDAVRNFCTSDINSNGNDANELSCTNRSEAEVDASPTEETAQRRISATESLDSKNIRSISLDHRNHGYDDSSAFDSNSEADSDFDDIVPSPQPNSIHLNKSSSSSIVMMDKSPDGRHSSMMCASNDTSPNIGSIAVQNSSDITFGNKTFYQGPVTIKQFVYDKTKWRTSEFPSSEGTPENDNLDFVNSSTDKLSRMNTGKHNELEKKWNCTSRQSLYAATIAGILACSLLALIVIVKYSNSEDSKVRHIGDGDDSRLNEPIKTNIGGLISDTAGALRVISRKEWIAQPPNNKLERLELPVGRVIIAHTATESCSTQADCTFQVRTIQTFHIESRGWDDIGYNFLVGGDGAIYVGRGWEDMGAHTKGYNFGSICFAFIGTFNTITPPTRQLVAVQKMMEEGVKLKKLTPDYKLYGHRQFFATLSPGTALYEIIQKWNHWNDTVPPPNP